MSMCHMGTSFRFTDKMLNSDFCLANYMILLEEKVSLKAEVYVKNFCKVYIKYYKILFQLNSLQSKGICITKLKVQMN